METLPSSAWSWARLRSDRRVPGLPPVCGSPGGLGGRVEGGDCSSRGEIRSRGGERSGCPHSLQIPKHKKREGFIGV